MISKINRFEQKLKIKIKNKSLLTQALTHKSANQIKNNNFSYPMLKWAKELFPLCRSLTGNGTRKTLNYFKNINKEFKIIKFKSGKKVFDWVIPQEWNINDAYIEHESKKRFAEFKKNNLHIIGYSIPINITLTRKQLLKKM